MQIDSVAECLIGKVKANRFSAKGIDLAAQCTRVGGEPGGDRNEDCQDAVYFWEVVRKIEYLGLNAAF